MAEYRPQLDRRKFRNLVLYIGQRAWDDPTLGKTRLYKTLWLSDFLAFARFGRSITGATYVHMPRGPGPDGAEELLDEMQSNEDILVRAQQRFARTIQRPLALREPQLDDVFDASEIAIVEEVLRQFEGQTAVDTSEWAHQNSVGWRFTRNGERIAYETIFLSPEEPTDEALTRGRDLASKYGWD